MDKLHVLLSTALLSVLVSCGAGDIGKTSRNGKKDPARKTEAAENDTNPIVMSQLHRNRGAAILSAEEEVENILKRSLGDKYRTVPDMMIDDEGTSKSNVLFAERPTVNCGIDLDLEGIDKRISECKTNNAKNSSWDGGEKGAAGESLWKLVYNDETTTPNTEIWLDTRTGLVWTDILSRTGNWCQASGNDQDLTSTNLPSGIECSSLREGESFCARLPVTGIGSNIVWRLPTRNDFLQADLNGMRFVFSPKNKPLWTATLVAGSPNRDVAWTWNDKTGVLAPTQIMTDNSPVIRSIRCVGAPKR